MVKNCSHYVFEIANDKIMKKKGIIEDFNLNHVLGIRHLCTILIFILNR